MKFWIILIFMFLALPVFAVEDVILDIEDDLDEQDVVSEEVFWDEILSPELKNSLYEKIKRINKRDYSNIKKSSFLLDEILTRKFDKGPIESMHIFGYYRAYADFDMSDDAESDYAFNAIYAGVDGRFRDPNTYYEARFRFNQIDGYNFWQTLPVDVFIANTSIPHNKIILGNTRTATGYEGSRSDAIIPFVARAQIARNLGNIRKLGIRVKGKYDLVEYDIGGYSSDTYFRKFFPGAEFAGWVNFKPLGKTDGKYGRLKLGGGLTAGQNDTDYTVTGLYAGYEYKNFMANFEYANADGYNGARSISENKAEGFYTTVGYRVTPKVQLVARYDQFTPNKEYSNDIRREYSTGINYFIKGQALKLMLNYVFCQNDVLEDSHRIILGTQVML